MSTGSSQDNGEGNGKCNWHCINSIRIDRHMQNNSNSNSNFNKISIAIVIGIVVIVTQIPPMPIN